MADAGLGRQMDHSRKSMPCKQRRDRRTIRKIGLRETEPWIFAQVIQPRPLQVRVIVIVQIVEADDLTAFGQQPAGDVKADETRRTRDQNRLIRHHIPNGFGSAPPRRPEPL